MNYDLPKTIKGNRRQDLIKILDFARLCGLKGIAFAQTLVSYKDETPVAYYSRENRLITISGDFTSEAMISILLHELGHHLEMNQRPTHANEDGVILDFSMLMPEGKEERLAWAYEVEKKAWFLAEATAKLLNIKLPVIHKEIKKLGLDSYKPEN